VYPYHFLSFTNVVDKARSNLANRLFEPAVGVSILTTAVFCRYSSFASTQS